MKRLWKSELSRSLLSPAKVNLILRVGGKRSDGFHAIETLMARLNWGDNLSFRLRPSTQLQVEVECSDASIPSEANLVTHAATNFAKKFRLNFSLKVNILKRIPTEAGLAGGSSNAALTLRFLAEHLLSSRKKKELFGLAAHLGSDVPFFLQTTNAAWCWGRGELCTPLTLPTWPLILAFPKSAKVSTPEAYGWLRRPEQSVSRNALPGRPHWLKSVGELQVPVVENDFEGVVLERHPELKKLRADFCLSGALSGGLSGSGSTYFGLYRSQSDAKRASRWMRDQGWKVVQTTLGSS